MTDPGRLIESGGASERALLGAARSLRATSASRQRALVSLGLASALSLAPATALAALKWLKGTTLTLVGSQWGAGVIITTVAVGAATVHVAQRAKSPEVAAVTTVPRAHAPAPIATTERAPAPVELIPTPALPPAEPARAPAARSATLPSVPAVSELELLDSARSQLRAGNASAALATLGEHQRLHPRGRMGTEARVLRIEALGASGRRDQALREARQFLEQNPNGLLSHRVRRWLDGQEKR